MKKQIAGLVLFLLCFILTAITPSHTFYNYTELKENVVRVELIYYDNPEAGPMGLINRLRGVENVRGLPDFDFSKMEYIETMNEERFEAFFDHISRVQWILTRTRSRQLHTSPSGISIIMHYQNGEFDVLSGNFIGRFNSEGGFIRLLGHFGGGRSNINSIVNVYFEMQEI